MPAAAILPAQPLISIDVRAIAPHRRHSVIFTAFDDLGLGQAMELIADHEPKPLFVQFRERSPEEFDWTYLELGPEQWRVAITKLKASKQCCGSCCG